MVWKDPSFHILPCSITNSVNTSSLTNLLIELINNLNFLVHMFNVSFFITLKINT
jgi:hypothetical protein